MGTFGNITSRKSVLICFMLDFLEQKASVVELAHALDGKADVVTIDMQKNLVLCDALRINKPVYIYASEGQMLHRFAAENKTLENVIWELLDRKLIPDDTILKKSAEARN